MIIKEEFLEEFENILAEEGSDVFFSTGDVDKDFSIVEGTIKSQGFWSGSRLRYFFDDDLNFLRTEERIFG